MRASIHGSKQNSFVCAIVAANVDIPWAILHLAGLLGTGISRRLPILPNDPWCDDCLSFSLRETID